MRLVPIIVAALVIGTGAMPAAAQISGSDLPGRERDRFVDPPGAGLLQPRGPNTALPYGANGPQFGCPPGKSHHKQRARKRCR
jgi:hypothetical protein